MRRSIIPLSVVALLAFGPTASPEEKPAPRGFTPLFNGKDLTGWKTNKGGKIEAWGAEDGVIFTKGGGGGWLMTEAEYGDFDLRLEFKLPTERAATAVWPCTARWRATPLTSAWRFRSSTTSGI